MIWTDEQVLYLKDNYGKLKTKDIAIFLNKQTKAVNTKAERLGLKSQLTSAKYTFNKEIFNSLTLENCYWAGFIAADGCITKKHNCIRLQFGQKYSDIEILEAFKKYISSDAPIKKRTNSNTEQAVFEVGNISSWIDCLQNNFNLKPNSDKYTKSYHLEPPNLKNEYALAFIIGLLDGDGSISDKTIIRLSWYGREGVLKWVSDSLHKIEDNTKYLKPAKVTKSRTSYGISYTHQRAKQIILELKKIKVSYKLNRKWNKINE